MTSPVSGQTTAPALAGVTAEEAREIAVEAYIYAYPLVTSELTRRVFVEPYEKFAQMLDRHWDGVAAYCKPENKVSLEFVEGLNNKMRVIQRRAYGLRDEKYLRLKILTCMLPTL